MALVKSYTMANGITCDNAYHIVNQVQQWKRAVDDPDPDGMRPENSPPHAWQAGTYGRISVVVYASAEARAAGRSPIACYAKYPTEAPGGDFMGEINILQAADDLSFTINMESGVSITQQAYEHMLTLETWSGATQA
jgi:hypothetical protein